MNKIFLDKQIENLISEIKRVCKEVKFISMSRSENETTINLEVRPKSFSYLTKFSGNIKRKYKNSRVILSYNDDLSL